MTYNGLLNDESLITNEANSRIFQATGVPPICTFKNDHQISIVEVIYELTSKEVKVKDFKAVNPMIKGVKRFWFWLQPKINRQQFLDFESLIFLENNNNIILIENIGVSNPHLATSIGIAAVNKRVGAYFIKR